MPRSAHQATGVLLAIVMVLTSLPARAQPLDALQALDAAAAAATEREALRALLGRDEVRAALVREGVDPEQALARVAALSDAEVLQVSDRIDQVPAGGSLAGVVVFVFVVLLVTDILGLTKVFPFTRSVR